MFQTDKSIAETQPGLLTQPDLLSPVPETESHRLFKRRQRQALIAAENGKCAVCGHALTVQWEAHHRLPFAKGGLTDVANGLALCRQCHRQEHRRTRKNSPGPGTAWAMPCLDADGRQVLPGLCSLAADTTENSAQDLANLSERLEDRPADLDAASPASEQILPALDTAHCDALRDWQNDAQDTLLRAKVCRRSNFLACACPGAGKTNLALSFARMMLESRDADRIVVLVPTCHLKKQWAGAAQRYGIRLTANWGNDLAAPEQTDTHGAIITFAQVAAFPEASRAHCARRPTLLVSDEHHHCGSNLSWGRALFSAFEPAAFRLLLSGTPFRSDANAIPWVSYKDGTSIADYSYGYGAALRDGICRPLVFPTYEGQMEWRERGETITATFSEDLDAGQMSRRLRTALDSDGDWLPSVLRAADERLTDVRRRHPEAGGLIAAMDQRHARQIAALMKSVTGEAPVVVTCDDPEASAAIERYARSARRWIVAVKMVSEGVDIPRLRVGVYASHVVSELFLRQWLGRFVRVVPDLEDDPYQFGFIFLPKDPRLVQIVQAIQAERNHVLLDRTLRTALEDMDAGESGHAGQLSAVTFAPIASASREDAVYADGHAYPPELLSQARHLQARGSAALQRLPETAVAEIIRLSQTHNPVIQHNPAMQASGPVPAAGGVKEVGSESSWKADRPIPTFDQENKRLRAAIMRLARRVALQQEISYESVHRAWFTRSGLRQGHATNTELAEKLAWLESILLGKETVTA